MVQLEEIKDEDDLQIQVGPEDDEDFTDTDSEISEVDDFPPLSESFSERIAALQDMIPPATRRRLNSTFSTTSSYAWSGLRLGGSALWIISTTVLLIGVPLGLSVIEEQGMMEVEMEQKAREIGQNTLTAGDGQAQAAL